MKQDNNSILSKMIKDLVEIPGSEILDEVAENLY